VSRSRRPFELLPVINRSESPAVEAAVMASEIEQLADLCGYLKLASRREWLQVALPRPAPQRTVERGPRGCAGVARPELVSADAAERAHEEPGLE
jgi:hypothetical protein